MANRWAVPDWLEQEIQDRDKACVYCGQAFTSAGGARKSAPSWEHIINDATLITHKNIALCCCGCNASKGQKKLSAWLQSRYCKDRGINHRTLAPFIMQALENGAECQEFAAHQYSVTDMMGWTPPLAKGQTDRLV